MFKEEFELEQEINERIDGFRYDAVLTKTKYDDTDYYIAKAMIDGNLKKYLKQLTDQISKRVILELEREGNSSSNGEYEDDAYKIISQVQKQVKKV